MRFLLIAYDFPPIPSPQSLRWTYLARELAFAGHQVHVLAPDVLGYGSGALPELPDGVVVHRAWAGPFTGHLVRRQREQRKRQAAVVRPPARCAEETDQHLRSPAAAPGPSGLNWKGRLFNRLNRLLSWVLFPDMRAEWGLPAKRVLDRLLIELVPDIVISSHEPPVSIPLGLYAKRRGFVWIADLGDPVLAPYTPTRWRRRAFGLERALCREADLVTVTTDSALAMLQTRHGLPEVRSMVLTQGFDHRLRIEEPGIVEFEPNRLELLYTGSFYAFRRPDILLQAVAEVPAARLTIATINPPQELLAAAERNPDSIRLLGFIGHLEALGLQRRCDLLINIANTDPVQVPGKLYEYLGSSSPILNIGGLPGDAAAELLSRLEAGWTVNNSVDDISDLLRRLVKEKQSGRGRCSQGGAENLRFGYSWQSLAMSLHARCARLLASR